MIGAILKRFEKPKDPSLKHEADFGHEDSRAPSPSSGVKSE